MGPCCLTETAVRMVAFVERVRRVGPVVGAGRNEPSDVDSICTLRRTGSRHIRGSSAVMLMVWRRPGRNDGIVVAVLA